MGLFLEELTFKVERISRLLVFSPVGVTGNTALDEHHLSGMKSAQDGPSIRNRLQAEIGT